MRAWLATALVCVCSLPCLTRAEGVAPVGRPVDSVFFIEKSENRNQVHYGVRVDRNCAPIGDEPVYGYWRNLEESKDARSPLLSIEQRGYGVSIERSKARATGGGSVHFSLRGLAGRRIVIDTFSTPEGCRAVAAARILDQVAELRSIYVKLGGLLNFQVDQLLLRGTALSTHADLVETVRPGRKN